MIPAVIIGLFFEDFIASLFKGKIAFVGGMLFITAFLLYFADKVSQNNKEFNYENSFYIGIIQAIAILPGISRSGLTICSSVILGINRELAAKFSFIMVLPLIFGSFLKIMIFDEFFEFFWGNLVRHEKGTSPEIAFWLAPVGGGNLLTSRLLAQTVATFFRMFRLFGTLLLMFPVWVSRFPPSKAGLTIILELGLGGPVLILRTPVNLEGV